MGNVKSFRRIVLLSLILNLFMLFSCEDSAVLDGLGTEHTIESGLYTSVINSQILEESNISISTISIEGKTKAVQIVGQFTEDRTALKAVNSFKVNNLEIPFVEDRYIGNYPDALSGAMPIFDQISGKNIKIDVSNNFGSSISGKHIYNPAPIVFSLNVEESYLSRENGLRLTWEPDNSALSEFDSVAVSVIYRGIDGNEFEELEDIDLSFSTADDGQLFISGNDLSVFPENSLLDINMTRGNFKIIEHSGNNIETLVVAFSMDSHRIVLKD